MTVKVLDESAVKELARANISKAYEVLEALHNVLSDSDKHLNRAAALEQIEEAQGVLMIAHGDLHGDNEGDNVLELDAPFAVPLSRPVKI